MTEQKSGAQISTKAFLQAVAIIFFLMMVAGILTRVVPAGQYARVEVDGRQVIDADLVQTVDRRPNYPIWRWFTAPFEVLGAEGNITVIAIILFILLVGVAFAVMDKSGILKSVISRIIKAFGGRKYALLLVITFFFMALGAFFGIFEEVIPLVPIIIALSFSLGWDFADRPGHVHPGDQRRFFDGGLQSVHHRRLAETGRAAAVLRRPAAHRAFSSSDIPSWQSSCVPTPRRSTSTRRPRPVFQEDQKERLRLGSFEVDKTDDPRMRTAIIFLAIFFAADPGRAGGLPLRHLPVGLCPAAHRPAVRHRRDRRRTDGRGGKEPSGKPPGMASWASPRPCRC